VRWKGCGSGTPWLRLDDLVLGRTPVAIALSYRVSAAPFLPKLDNRAVRLTVKDDGSFTKHIILDAGDAFALRKLLIGLLFRTFDVDGRYAHVSLPVSVGLAKLVAI